MFISRRCARTACSRPATTTLTYDYESAQAVLGPLSADPEPGCYDLCREHAESLRPPHGWEVIRLMEGPTPSEPAPSTDDLMALADAVREAAAAWDEMPTQRRREPAAAEAPVVELARRGHLSVVADPSTHRRG